MKILLDELVKSIQNYQHFNLIFNFLANVLMELNNVEFPGSISFKRFQIPTQS